MRAYWQSGSPVIWDAHLSPAETGRIPSDHVPAKDRNRHISAIDAPVRGGLEPRQFSPSATAAVQPIADIGHRGESTRYARSFRLRGSAAVAPTRPFADGGRAVSEGYYAHRRRGSVDSGRPWGHLWTAAVEVRHRRWRGRCTSTA